MTTTMPTPTVVGRPEDSGPKSSGMVLAAALLGFFVTALDALVVNVALPAISSDIGGGITGLQWVVDGYTLMFAALMLSAGSLSDRIGASRAFGGGLALFTIASAACGLAPTLWLLIVARFVQGAAASIMMPASLALVRQAFPDAQKRIRAIATWTAGGAIAAAAGPVAGGALTAAIGWRSIFFLNIPVGIIGLILLARAPRSPRRSAPLDLGGQLTGILALAGITYGVIEGGSLGYSAPLVIGAFVLAGLAALAFVLIERRQATPMMPLHLFRVRTVWVTTAVGFTINVAFYGTIFVLSLFFQQVRGQDALAAGLMFLPMTAVVAIMNLFFAAKVIRRFGPRLPIALGQAGTGIALVVLLTATVHMPTLLLTLLVIPVAFAGSLAVPALTALLMGSVPAERAGAAAGILNTARQVGAALAVALFGVLVSHPQSFQSGMRISLVIGAAVLLSTTVATMTLLKKKPE